MQHFSRNEQMRSIVFSVYEDRVQWLIRDTTECMSRSFTHVGGVTTVTAKVGEFKSKVIVYRIYWIQESLTLHQDFRLMWEFTAHLTPYCALRVLHLLPAQPLHTHVGGVWSVVAWLGQRRRVTGWGQGRRWGRRCLENKEMLSLLVRHLNQ